MYQQQVKKVGWSIGSIIMICSHFHMETLLGTNISSRFSGLLSRWSSFGKRGQLEGKSCWSFNVNHGRSSPQKAFYRARVVSTWHVFVLFSSGVFPRNRKRRFVPHPGWNGEKNGLSPLLGCFVCWEIFCFWAGKNDQQQSWVVNFRHWKQSGLGISRKIEIHDFPQQLHL